MSDDELLASLERLRRRLYKAGSGDKDMSRGSALRLSRKMDRLIVEYHRRELGRTAVLA